MKKILIAAIVCTIALVSNAVSKHKPIYCPGLHTNHLQGITAKDGKIYWSHTTKLIKTDLNGNLEEMIDVQNHHGDLCIDDQNKIYVAVKEGKFNTFDKAKNFVYVYDTNLNPIDKIAIKELAGGLGGMEYHNGYFYLVGGIEASLPTFQICKFTKDFKLVKTYEIPVLDSYLGVQTICYAYGKFWLGCYLKPKAKLPLWELDENFNLIKRHANNGSMGIVKTSDFAGANFLVAHHKKDKSRFASCKSYVTAEKIVPSEEK